MARKSTKENKNIYQRTREGLGLTREEASDLLVTMSPERIEKIENERSMPHPDEVLLMSDQYKHPSLCNYYCANQCPIGQQYVPEIKIKDLSQIVLETLASLNAMNKKRNGSLKSRWMGKSPAMSWQTSCTFRRSSKRFPSPWRHCSSGASGCLITVLSTVSSTKPIRTTNALIQE